MKRVWKKLFKNLPLQEHFYNNDYNHCFNAINRFQQGEKTMVNINLIAIFLK